MAEEAGDAAASAVRGEEERKEEVEKGGEGRVEMEQDEEQQGEEETGPASDAVKGQGDEQTEQQDQPAVKDSDQQATEKGGNEDRGEGQRHQEGDALQSQHASARQISGASEHSEAKDGTESQQQDVVPQTDTDVKIAVVDKDAADAGSNSEEQPANERTAEPRVESPPPPPPPSSQGQAGTGTGEAAGSNQQSAAHAASSTPASSTTAEQTAQASAPPHAQPTQHAARKRKTKKRQQPEDSRSPQERAQQYLEENKVGELIENMTAQLVFHRPEDPRTFLIDYVDKLQERAEHLDEPQDELPVLFDASNAKAVFRTYDPSNRGWISMSQYHQAMKNLFFKEYNDEPKGFVEGRITIDTFVEECMDASANATMTFKI